MCTDFSQVYVPETMSGENLDEETPLLAALPLFATSLSVFRLLGWRRKRMLLLPQPDPSYDRFITEAPFYGAFSLEK